MKTSFSHLKRPILIMAAVGATLGVLLDGLHSHFGATSYTDPVFAKTAWWAVPLFTSAYVGGIARPLINDKPTLSPKEPLVAMALFVLAYGLTVAPFDVSTRVALLIATFATGFHFCDPSRACVIVALISAFAGPFVEVNLVRAGLFVHHENHFAGIPVWLPFLYLNAGVGLGSAALWLVQREATQQESSASPHRLSSSTNSTKHRSLPR